MIVRRRLVPRALVAAVAALGLLAASHRRWQAQPRRGGSQWGTCANADAAAAGWQCATFKAPKDYGNPGAGSTQDRRHAAAREDQAHRIGALFVNYGGPGGDAVATTQAIGADLFGAVNDHFDIVAFDPRGTGESYARDRLQGEPGDAGPLLGAVHDAREPRRQGADRQGQGLHQALRRAQQGDPAVRVDRQRGARHGRHPRRDGRQEAQLLRLLVRHVPRRDLHEPLPRQLPRDGARRPGRRQRLHQQARGRPARAVGRLRARARPVLPGLRAGPVVLPVRRRRPVGGLRRARRPGQRARRSRPTASPTIRGRSTATTSSSARSSRCTPSSNWPVLAQALSEAAAGDGTLLRFLADAFWGNNSTARSIPAPTATSRSARSSSATRRDVDRSSTPATTRGACSTHFWSTPATPS